MRGSDRMHALYLHFTDAPLSDYARAGNHSAALQITFIFYSAEICMISKSRNSSPDPIELNSGWCDDPGAYYSCSTSMHYSNYSKGDLTC